MSLWHGSWVLMSKTFFPVWNLDSCSLKPARKSLWFICLSNKQQVWSNIWVFWKKFTICHFLLGIHLSVQFHLFWVTTVMGFNIHRTLSLDLFSHGMVQCVPVVSLLAQKLQRIMFFWTWALGTIGKSNIFLLWKLENCSLNTDRKTPWFIFLFIKTPLVKYLSFLKKPGYLPLLSGKSSDSTVSPNWVWELWQSTLTEPSSLIAFLMERYSMS